MSRLSFASAPLPRSDSSQSISQVSEILEPPFTILIAASSNLVFNTLKTVFLNQASDVWEDPYPQRFAPVLNSVFGGWRIVLFHAGGRDGESGDVQSLIDNLKEKSELRFSGRVDLFLIAGLSVPLQARVPVGSVLISTALEVPGAKEHLSSCLPASVRELLIGPPNGASPSGVLAPLRHGWPVETTFKAVAVFSKCAGSPDAFKLIKSARSLRSPYSKCVPWVFVTACTSNDSASNDVGHLSEYLSGVFARSPLIPRLPLYDTSRPRSTRHRPLKRARQRRTPVSSDEPAQSGPPPPLPPVSVSAASSHAVELANDGDSVARTWGPVFVAPKRNESLEDRKDRVGRLVRNKWNAKQIESRAIFLHTNWRAIRSVDTVNQTFDAVVDVEAHVRCRQDLDGRYYSSRSYPKDFLKIRFTNWDGDNYIKPEIRYREVQHVDGSSEDLFVVFIWKLKGRFGERFELRQFPFDEQKLSIWIRTEHPVWTFCFTQHPTAENLILTDREIAFVSQAWNLADKLAPLQVYFSDPAMDPHDRVFSNVAISAMVQRDSIGYWKFFFILCVLASLSGAAYIFPANDPGNRLSIVLNLFLITVAYQFLTSAETTKIAYQTWLDWYAFACLILLSLVIALICCAAHFESDLFDTIGKLCLYGVWVVFNVVFVARMCLIRRAGMYHWHSRFEDTQLVLHHVHSFAVPEVVDVVEHAEANFTDTELNLDDIEVDIGVLRPSPPRRHGGERNTGIGYGSILSGESPVRQRNSALRTSHRVAGPDARVSPDQNEAHVQSP